MTVQVKTPQGDYVEVTCRCGQCALITSAQMQEFRHIAHRYGNDPLPDTITVGCSPTALTATSFQLEALN